MPFASVEGGQIHYRLQGEPNLPVLVFSNALGTNLSMWDAQVPTFTPQFRVLRYDSFGHGTSSHSAGEYKMDMLARDVIRLLDQLSIPSAYFCGVSIGGLVGQWLALNTTKRITKLVLCSTGARMGTDESWNSHIEAASKGGMSSVSQPVLDQWFSPPFQQSDPTTVDRFRKMLVATPLESYVATCAAIRDTDFRSEISKVRVKTLVVAATPDKSTPPEDGRFLAERILGSQYVELNSGNLSNVELPQKFSQDVLKFLAR